VVAAEMPQRSGYADALVLRLQIFRDLPML